MITNAQITAIVATNCPGCFEEPFDVRGLIIPERAGPQARRYFIMRQQSFEFTELANLADDFGVAGCDVDINVGPCGECDMLVEARVEIKN